MSKKKPQAEAPANTSDAAGVAATQEPARVLSCCNATRFQLVTDAPYDRNVAPTRYYRCPRCGTTYKHDGPSGFRAVGDE